MIQKLAAFVSLLSSLGMGGLAWFTHDLGTGFTSVGAFTMALVLYQQSDFKTRLERIESHLMISVRRKPHG